MDRHTTPDFTKQDWEDLRRRSRWNSSYDQVQIQKFLQAKSINEITSTKEDVSFAASYIVQFALLDFFKDEGYTVVKTADIEHDGDYSPSYRNIEYEHNKTKSCLHDGCYFVEKGELRYIYRISPSPNGMGFSIFSHVKTKPTTGEFWTKIVTYAKKHNYLKGKKIDPKCRIIPLDRKYDWSDLVLDEDRKDDIRRNLSNIINYSELYKKNNLQIKRGLIFHGPPGTGKTLLGKILCSTVDWTFVWVTPKFLQDSRDVSKIVNICRDLSPSILFLEDMDLYGGTRDQNRDVGVLGELMNALDGIEENNNIITIATTNDKDKLEKALLSRPGRFDRVIEFSAPQSESRLNMLRLFTKDISLEKTIDLSKVSNYLDKLTGAQIKELVNLAILYAIDDKSLDENNKIIVKGDHLRKALPSVKKKDYQSSVGFSSSEFTPRPALDFDWDNDDY
jgi:cell division protease FtsH